ncbi:hypothetical protein J5226_15845 [Lysobacter sp. K5869]|uniref:hypothetical protein n=1 Tax=Lysobacter sp. K5869 TaxID=2820808 RepID=UPI001C0627CA|nr:hypothetical protein [Lysobacter sp. K5869]QWP75102.1 hypothetical protein J5226_15845 [Lysobacter sp. K5869]
MHHKSSALLFALLLGAGAMFVPRPAQAFCTFNYYYWQFMGACMTQPTQILNKVEWVSSYTQDVSKYKNWIDQVKKNKERFEQLNPGNFNLGEMTGTRVQIEDLKERPVGEGVDAVCGEKGRSVVADEQYNICKAKQQLINRRYNLMVKMFKDAETRDKKIADIRANRGGISGAKDAGRLIANTNTSMQLKAGTVNDGQNYLMTMELYTSMIAVLDDQMAKTARRALTNEGANQKGPFGLPPIAGKVVQGVALKAGLSLAQSREL